MAEMKVFHIPLRFNDIILMFISKGISIGNEDTSIILDDMIYRVSMAYATQKTITEHVTDIVATASFSDLINLCSEEEVSDLLNNIRNTLLEIFNIHQSLQFLPNDTVVKVVGNRAILRRE